MSQSALKTHIATLEKHRLHIEKISLRALFDADAQRAEHFSVEDNDLLFDYSKNRIDKESLKALVALAHSAGLSEVRQKMFAGDRINFTENRAVLHTALRANNLPKILVDGIDVKAEIAKVQKSLFDFSEKVRSGEYQLSGGAITDVVNIGIGGSDLGPAMCVAALSPFHSGPKAHFVSNVDSADFYDTTKHLNPATTLFIIASKSFTTAETMANARLARNWLSETISPEIIGRHFVALSTNLEATAAFGIDAERTFGFWDWVGGRYSIWSAIGLSLILAIGTEYYQQFLDGGQAADEHFLSREFESNIPVLMALIGIWHRNVWNFPTHAILPYDNRLSRFPAYLQQLDMESNGKHVCQDGTATAFPTGPIIWGEPGTNGQHAFYQLLHQGTDIIPCDFLIAAKSHEDNQSQQKMLAANCFAQSAAMMIGRSRDEAIDQLAKSDLSDERIKQLVSHRVFVGNRPSSTILYPQLTPFVLGQLIAFYEHKIFVQGVIWEINSFDQWGVELGKHLANKLYPLLNDANRHEQACHDASTRQLIEKFLNQSK